MPTPAERKREKNKRDTARMTAAADEVRRRRATRYAGLAPDEADALATLVEAIASTGGAGDLDWRTWEQARRVAEAILTPPPSGHIPYGAAMPAGDWHQL